jgi:hypothetical protein|tara:strand:- start:836 stop:1225 length:390 start_codon:yes stop_codon:yes gene_type:complete
MNEKIIDSLPYIAPILTAIGAYKWDWLMNKLNIKQKSADVETTALSNLQKNLDIYQGMVTDLDRRYKERIQDFEDNFSVSMDRLRVEIDELKKINSELEGMVIEQKEFILKQSRSLQSYEKKFGKLPTK